MAALTRLVDTLRVETGAHVPWIDPFCGGIGATILLVLKRPGRLGATATVFLSLANGDATARNTIEVMSACNIVYADLVFWNAIPWSGDREEVVTNGMISNGSKMLQRLLALLPRLQVAVLLGQEAQKIDSHVAWPAHIRRINSAHPGPFVWNQHRYRSQKLGIFEAFQQAASMRP